MRPPPPDNIRSYGGDAVIGATSVVSLVLAADLETVLSGLAWRAGAPVDRGRHKQAL